MVTVSNTDANATGYAWAGVRPIPATVLRSEAKRQTLRARKAAVAKKRQDAEARKKARCDECGRVSRHSVTCRSKNGNKYY